MTAKSNLKKSPFQLDGNFVDLVRKSDGKPRAIVVGTGDKNLRIKLSKKLRKTWNFNLNFGDEIQISGWQKIKSKKMKFKADEIFPFDRPSDPPQNTPELSPKFESGKIMLCQKSGCLKRGGKNLNKALKTALKNLGLQDNIKIVPTGCQKRCKKAPNLVMMPAKTKYGNISPKDVPPLLKEHYLI